MSVICVTSGVFSRQLALKCAVKGAGLQRVQLPPGNWSLHPVAIETTAEATKRSELSMERVARRLREPAGHNASERGAGPETTIAGADLTLTQGRPLTMERRRANKAPSDLPGWRRHTDHRVSFPRAGFGKSQFGSMSGLCQEDERTSCCTKDEGGSFGVAL